MTPVKPLLCAAVAVSLFTACHKKAPETNEVAAAFRMSDSMMRRCRFAPARLQETQTELKLFGKVTADNNRQAQVYPVVGGEVLRIHAELGDYVRQGQVLATIRSSEVAEFQKERLDAQSDVAVAEKNLRVARDLFAGQLNSERDVTAAEQELAKARAAQRRIGEVYTIYKLGSGSQYNLSAPISGFIIRKDINQNEQLRSDRSEPVFAIAQISEVWVLANVNESDIGQVREGMEAVITTISYPDRSYRGKVDKIFNAIDPETKALKVRIRIPNADLSLKPEMNATVALRASDGHRRVAVPSSALIFDKSRTWVMVFKSRTRLETRPVEVFRELGDTAYLESGLQEGETIISQNGLMLYDALND